MKVVCTVFCQSKIFAHSPFTDFVFIYIRKHRDGISYHNVIDEYILFSICSLFRRAGSKRKSKVFASPIRPLLVEIIELEKNGCTFKVFLNRSVC